MEAREVIYSPPTDTVYAAGEATDGFFQPIATNVSWVSIESTDGLSVMASRDKMTIEPHDDTPMHVRLEPTNRVHIHAGDMSDEPVNTELGVPAEPFDRPDDAPFPLADTED